MNAPLPAAASVPEVVHALNEAYLVRSRLEIVALLRGMIHARQNVTVYFFDQSFVTVLLSANPEFEELVFDASEDPLVQKRLLSASHLTFVTFIDRVKVQFSGPRPELTSWENSPALRVRIPDAVLRLQRRDTYRVKLPIAKPVLCELSLPEGAPPTIRLRVNELSTSGATLVADGLDPRLQNGAQFEQCRIDLPGVGPINTGIEIRNCSDIVGPTGNSQRRLGCSFVDLPRGIEPVLQRYLTQVERERRAKL